MPPRNVTVICLAAVLSLACYEKAQRNRYASVVGDALRLIDLHYLEEADDRKLFESAMQGLVADLDQYSAYIGPQSFQEMESSLDQEFGGVGVEVEKPDKKEPLTVLSPIVGSPAYRAGVRAGDRILEIDGASTLEMELKEATQRMRGKPGSQVRLLVQHAGGQKPIPIVITREVIVIDSVLGDTRLPDGSWDYRLATDPRILKLTTAGYSRPSGKNIHRHKDATEKQDWGVSPNKGFEVVLSDEETQRVFLQRRDRDVFNRPAQPPKGNAQPGAAPGKNSSEKTEPVVDLQLRRATEYIQQRLNHAERTQNAR